MCVRRDLSSGCVTAAAALLQACAKFLEASSAYVASHAPSRAPARAGEVPVTQDPRAHPPGFTGRQGTAIFDAPLCVPLPLQARRLAEADCGVAASRFVVTTLKHSWFIGAPGYSSLRLCPPCTPMPGTAFQMDSVCVERHREHFPRAYPSPLWFTSVWRPMVGLYDGG